MWTKIIINSNSNRSFFVTKEFEDTRLLNHTKCHHWFLSRVSGLKASFYNSIDPKIPQQRYILCQAVIRNLDLEQINCAVWIMIEVKHWVFVGPWSGLWCPLTLTGCGCLVTKFSPVFYMRRSSCVRNKDSGRKTMNKNREGYNWVLSQ